MKDYKKSPQNNYQLVNPYIVGDMQTVVSADSAHNAADKLWTFLSKNSKIYTDNFVFTLQSLKSGDYFHYKVSETAGSNGTADYKLSALKNVDVPKELKSRFEKRVEFLQNGGQSGGTRRYKKYSDDDDLDSEIDEEIEDWMEDNDDIFTNDETYQMIVNNRYSFLTPINKPLLYVYYDTFVYTNVINTSVSLPVLTMPHVVKINMSSSVHKWLRSD